MQVNKKATDSDLLITNSLSHRHVPATAHKYYADIY